MILFGLYSGQRLGDIATLRWKNIDLAHRELRFSTRKTGRTMILPLAEPLRKYIESLPIPVDLSAPVHPPAFGLLAGEVIVSESGEFSARERSEIASRLGIHWEEELIFRSTQSVTTKACSVSPGDVPPDYCPQPKGLPLEQDDRWDK